MSEVDGSEKNHGILVIATAKELSQQDVALLQRPLRFNAPVILQLADADLRRKFAIKWIEEKIGTDGLVWDASRVVDINGLLDTIVDSTKGWAYASLEELFVLCLASL